MGGGGGGEKGRRGEQDLRTNRVGRREKRCVRLFTGALQVCVHSDARKSSTLFVRARALRQGRTNVNHQEKKGGWFVSLAFDLFLTAARLHNSQAHLVCLT